MCCAVNLSVTADYALIHGAPLSCPYKVLYESAGANMRSALNCARSKLITSAFFLLFEVITARNRVQERICKE